MLHYFLKLQQELTNTEDRIQRARRFYNGNVREYNNRVQVVPSGLIAMTLDEGDQLVDIKKPCRGWKPSGAAAH
jgi:hypothetical protein